MKINQPQQPSRAHPYTQTDRSPKKEEKSKAEPTDRSQEEIYMEIKKSAAQHTPEERRMIFDKIQEQFNQSIVRIPDEELRTELPTPEERKKMREIFKSL